GLDYADTEVLVGGRLSDHKGVNVPQVVLPISAITEKDRADLSFALQHGADWIALSFVQRPEDVAEGRKLIGNAAGLMVKLEKPAAITRLDDIIELSDALMVARGDLGVEMPPEDVPSVQKQVIHACRVAGKPVIVATQMLESMIAAPTPTRAEASDVATAVYEGADAVMLSAETAVGQYPIEAVAMMDRIARRVQADPLYFATLDASRMPPEDVPGLQKRLLRACHRTGKPVIVATQMLESMISAPTPTRAEASDVATAVYEGADAVMLSAETAVGQYPIEAVAIMDRIARRVQQDPLYFTGLETGRMAHEETNPDAISAAACQVAQTLGAAAIVSFTSSGATALRAARERPPAPILAMTSNLATARRLALLWGAHCVHSTDIRGFADMVQKAVRAAHREGVAKAGQRLVITAGVPFGTPGSTNVLRIAWVDR
ncbi:MAG: pyruvate kinase, partial [Stellaceae bacterium]